MSCVSQPSTPPVRGTAATTPPQADPASISAISHLFLSAVREAHQTGAGDGPVKRPVRIPPRASSSDNPARAAVEPEPARDTQPAVLPSPRDPAVTIAPTSAAPVAIAPVAVPPAVGHDPFSFDFPPSSIAESASLVEAAGADRAGHAARSASSVLLAAPARAFTNEPAPLSPALSRLASSSGGASASAVRPAAPLMSPAKPAPLSAELLHTPAEVVLAAHLGPQQFARTCDYCAHLTAQGQRVALLEVDSGGISIRLFDTPEDTPAEICDEPAALRAAMAELDLDIDRWVVAVRAPRSPEGRVLLLVARRWTILCGRLDSDVVSAYRLLKAVSPLRRGVVGAAVFGSEQQGESVFARLSSTLDHFVGWRLTTHETIAPPDAQSQTAGHTGRAFTASIGSEVVSYQADPDAFPAEHWQLVADLLTRAACGSSGDAAPSAAGDPFAESAGSQDLPPPPGNPAAADAMPAAAPRQSASASGAPGDDSPSPAIAASPAPAGSLLASSVASPSTSPALSSHALSSPADHNSLDDDHAAFALGSPLGALTLCPNTAFDSAGGSALRIVTDEPADHAPIPLFDDTQAAAPSAAMSAPADLTPLPHDAASDPSVALTSPAGEALVDQSATDPAGDDVIELSTGDLPDVLSAAIRAAGLAPVELQLPHDLPARLAVGSDGALTIAMAAFGLDLPQLARLGRLHRWLTDSRQLIAWALRPAPAAPTTNPGSPANDAAAPMINPHAPASILLLADTRDTDIPAIAPLLQGSPITLRPYRTLRWSGRAALLLDAA